MNPHTSSVSVQAVLPLACPSCPYKVTGRCEGPEDGKTYLMQGKGVVGCLDAKRRGMFYEDTYGRFLPAPPSSHQEKIILPAFIPGVREGLRLDWGEEAPLVAVSLGKVVSQTGDLAFRDIDHLRRRLRLPQGARVALIGTGRDARLEAMWKVSDSKRVWERLARFGFEFVTSCTYSVWDRHPQFDQIRNQDRNFQTHDILAGLGVPTIPFLFPFNSSDYRAAGDWLKARPEVNKVAVLAQFYKSPHKFARFLDNMRLIQAAAPRKLEFLVVGIAQRYKIDAVMNEFSASVVACKPFQAALAGKRITSILEEAPGEGSRREVLATANIEQYIRCCDGLRQRQLRVA